jgi:hypothetical protein
VPILCSWKPRSASGAGPASEANSGTSSPLPVSSSERVNVGTSASTTDGRVGTEDLPGAAGVSASPTSRSSPVRGAAAALLFATVAVTPSRVAALSLEPDVSSGTAFLQRDFGSKVWMAPPQPSTPRRRCRSSRSYGAPWRCSSPTLPERTRSHGTSTVSARDVALRSNRRARRTRRAHRHQLYGLSPGDSCSRGGPICNVLHPGGSLAGKLSRAASSTSSLGSGLFGGSGGLDVVSSKGRTTDSNS